MFGGVKSELKTRTLPPGMKGHQMSFHYICGGNDAEACELSVELEEKSPTSYSKRTVWTLDDSEKAIGASALANVTWSHATINLPPTETESLVTLKLKYNYNKAGANTGSQIKVICKSFLSGGVGVDNIVFSSIYKCNPT